MTLLEFVITVPATIILAELAGWGIVKNMDRFTPGPEETLEQLTTKRNQ